MKKTIYGLGLGLMSVGMLASCGGGDTQKSKSPKPAPKPAVAATTEAGSLPNYRFIDSDTIMLKYNLSIDFNEQMIRLRNNLSDEEKRQQSAIQPKAAALQKKMESVQSQAQMDALKSEYEGIQKQQAQDEQKITQMGMDMEKTLGKNAQTVMDSLNNFLADYAAERGYDAVFFKNAAPFYNPALDVTDEVVEGLNARYNKVKTSGSTKK